MSRHTIAIGLASLFYASHARRVRISDSQSPFAILENQNLPNAADIGPLSELCDSYVNISHIDAILGGTVKVDIDGETHDLRLAEGTQPGSVIAFVVDNDASTSRSISDCITANVVISQPFSQRELELLQQLQKIQLSPGSFIEGMSDSKRGLATMLLALSPLQSARFMNAQVSQNGRSPFRSTRPRALTRIAQVRPLPSSQRRMSSLRMAVSDDLYARLGVQRGASDKEIKTAFRSKARQVHPDVSGTPEDTEIFMGISEAQEILLDPQKRRLYDQFGYDAVKRGGGAGGPGGPGFEDFDLGDIFESFFGGAGGGRGRRRDGPMQGDDLRFDIELDFKTAVFGGKQKIRINHLETCNTCGGNGVAPGSKVVTCRACGGKGVQVQQVATILGRIQQQVVCPTCSGTGQQVEKYCGRCSGKGRTRESKTVTVSIPCGVQNGNRLRVRGEGDAGEKGGPPGDLYCFIAVKKDPNFRREGKDIYSDVDISYVDAILGTTVKVKTVDGDVDLRVPPGTQPETVLRIEGRGAPELNKPDSRGSHFTTVKVKIPTRVSNKEKEVLETLRN